MAKSDDYSAKRRKELIVETKKNLGKARGRIKELQDLQKRSPEMTRHIASWLADLPSQIKYFENSIEFLNQLASGQKPKKSRR